MTFQDAITNARGELGDTFSGNYTYADADMLRYAIEGVREAWTVRPSHLYDEDTGLLYDVSTVFPATVSVVTEIPLPESVQYGIAYYIIYGCLTRDVTDEENAKVAEVEKEKFNQVMFR